MDYNSLCVTINVHNCTYSHYIYVHTVTIYMYIQSLYICTYSHYVHTVTMAQITDNCHHYHGHICLCVQVNV